MVLDSLIPPGFCISGLVSFVSFWISWLLFLFDFLASGGSLTSGLLLFLVSGFLGFLFL